MDIIQRLGGEGKSVLVSSHVLHEVQSLTPNIILLNHGRLVAEGHVRQIRDLIDKHPHHIVLVCDEYRKLAARLLAWDDVEGVTVLPKDNAIDGGDPLAGRLLRRLPELSLEDGTGDQGGVFRRRQSGSRLQVSGEQMSSTASSRRGTRDRPRQRRRPPRMQQAGSTSPDYGRCTSLTLRQHLHGKRWMVMGVLFLLPAGLAVIARATAPDVPSVGLEFLLAFMFIPQGDSAARGAALCVRHHPGRTGRADHYLPAHPADSQVGDLRRQAAGHGDDHGRADGGRLGHDLCGDLRRRGGAQEKTSHSAA